MLVIHKHYALLAISGFHTGAMNQSQDPCYKEAGAKEI